MSSGTNALLRNRFSLREAITVSTEHDEDDPLQPKLRDHIGERLALAAAGYLHETLLYEGFRSPELQVGVAWGFVLSNIADFLENRKASELGRLHSAGYEETRRRITSEISWFPLIGNLGMAVEPTQAAEISHRLCEIYGGKVKALGIGGIERPPCRSPSLPEQSYFQELSEHGDVILTSASDWHPKHVLLEVAKTDPAKLPPFDPQVAGLIGGVFLHPDGSQVPLDPDRQYRIASLGYEGYRSVALRGRVILVAGGRRRREVILAALRGRLVSVLVTTQETGRWLVEQPELLSRAGEP